MAVITCIFTSTVYLSGLALNTLLWLYVRRLSSAKQLFNENTIVKYAVESSLIINFMESLLLPLRADTSLSEVWQFGSAFCILAEGYELLVNILYQLCLFIPALDLALGKKRFEWRFKTKFLVYIILTSSVAVSSFAVFLVIGFNSNIYHDEERCDYLRVPVGLTVSNILLTMGWVCFWIGLLVYVWAAREEDFMESEELPGESIVMQTPEVGFKRKYTASQIPELPTRHRSAPLPPVRNPPRREKRNSAPNTYPDEAFNDSNQQTLPDTLPYRDTSFGVTESVQEPCPSEESDSIPDLDRTAVPNTVHRRLTLISPETFRSQVVGDSNKNLSSRGPEATAEDSPITRVNNYIQKGKETPRQRLTMKPVSHFTQPMDEPRSRVPKLILFIMTILIVTWSPLFLYTWIEAFCQCMADYTVYYALVAFSDVGFLCRIIITGAFVKISQNRGE